MSSIHTRQMTLLDAPSNLGLRPPAPGCVPGCAKLAGALRDQGLLDRLHAQDAGVLTPPRYRPDWQPGPRVRNSAGLANYTPRLAERIGRSIDSGRFTLVLGGDCSVLLGAGLALRQRGRYGLVFLDGHSDFRHLDNARAVGAAAGEDLALVSGRGQDDLANIGGLRPYFADADIAVLGIRENDEYASELTSLGIATRTATQCQQNSAEVVAAALGRAVRPDLAGFWIHLDVDILDPALMPAVDSPDPGGLDWATLANILTQFVRQPKAVGLEITVFDPDLDEDGQLAATLADFLVNVFQ